MTENKEKWVPKKLGIILDSLSGQPKEVLNDKYHFAFIPQRVKMGDFEFRDGVDELLADVQDRLFEAKVVKTRGATKPAIHSVMETMSAQYEHSLYIAAHSHIGSTFEDAKVIEAEFPNVHVIENHLCGQALIDAALMAQKIVEDGGTWEDAKVAVREISNLSHNYIVPRTLRGIENSGRLVGVKKFILEKTHRIPLLTFKDNGIHHAALVHTFEEGVDLAVKTLIEEIGEDDLDKFYWSVQNTGHIYSKDYALSALRQANIMDIEEEMTSALVAAEMHECVGIVVWPKIEYLLASYDPLYKGKFEEFAAPFLKQMAEDEAKEKAKEGKVDPEDAEEETEVKERIHLHR